MQRLRGCPFKVESKLVLISIEPEFAENVTITQWGFCLGFMCVNSWTTGEIWFIWLRLFYKDSLYWYRFDKVALKSSNGRVIGCTQKQVAHYYASSSEYSVVSACGLTLRKTTFVLLYAKLKSTRQFAPLCAYRFFCIPVYAIVDAV